MGALSSAVSPNCPLGPSILHRGRPHDRRRTDPCSHVKICDPLGPAQTEHLSPLTTCPRPVEVTIDAGWGKPENTPRLR